MHAVDREARRFVTPDRLAELRTRTIWQVVSEAAQRQPHRDALVAADDSGAIQRVSYRTLAERVRNLSAGLAASGCAVATAWCSG